MALLCSETFKNPHVYQHDPLKLDPGYFPTQIILTQIIPFVKDCLLFCLTPRLLETKIETKITGFYFYSGRCNPRTRMKKRKNETGKDDKQCKINITTRSSTSQWAWRTSASHLVGHLFSYPYFSDEPDRGRKGKDTYLTKFFPAPGFL